MKGMPDEWEEIVRSFTDMPCSNAIRSTLRRLALATAVYYIWKERNARIFTDVKIDAVLVLQNIIGNIKMQFLVLTVTKQIESVEVE